MDIQVERNAFGRQVASFEIDLHAPFLKDAMNARIMPSSSVRH